ncbi:MAG: GntR family transcriptional regulator [Roseobacter sp.]|jgi:DNA-binding GntR family transcriptional regulator|nr:GntR family transcriptional regulator [Roseobacter sp.]
MERKRSYIIADALERMIFDGTFSDGDRLDEVNLARQFNVSRTPLREAFQRLAQSGLVEQIPRRGVFVRQPGPTDLIQMFELMAELEASCARLAATRISDAALEELHETNAQCNASVGDKDSELYFQVNERFHAIIYRESGNEYLERECHRLHRRLQPFRRMQLRLRGRLNQSMSEHEDILSALEAGDGAKAAEAIRGHVAVQGEKFHHLIASLKQAAE